MKVKLSGVRQHKNKNNSHKLNIKNNKKKMPSQLF